jgi:hypothetical protein
MSIRFVPAFKKCTTEDANSTHGEPLNSPACDPPALESDSLTVDSPDSSGFAANATGSARLKVLCTDGGTVPCSTSGDTEDVAINVALTDVRCASSDAICAVAFGSDYVGKLLVRTSLQVTDRQNGTLGSAAGTVSEVPLDIPIDCTPTADLVTGSDCEANTTADALDPGIVRELSRSVWGFGQFEVLDAGPNGTGYDDCPPTCGDGDEQVFMRQGLFVP